MSRRISASGPVTWAAGVALGMAAGCGADEGPFLRLSLPSAGYRAAIVAIDGAARRAEPEGLRLWAIDLEASDAMPAMTGFGASDEVLVEALLFNRRLAELDLTPGRITVDAEAEVTRALPRHDALFASTITSAEATAWTPIDALPDRLATIRLAAHPTCRTPTQVPITWSGPDRVQWAIGWTSAGARGPDTAVIGLQDESVHAIDAARGRALTWTDGSVPVRAGHPGVDGKLLLTVGEGEIWSAGIDPDRDTITSRYDGAMAAHMEGLWMAAPVPIDNALFVLSTEWHREGRADNGHLVRYFLDGSVGRSLHYYPPDSSLPERNAGDLAWVGPDEVVALWPYQQDVVTRVAGGVGADESVPDPKQIEHVDGWGTVIGTGDGRLFLHRGGTDAWRVIEDHDSGIAHMAARDGVLWVSDDDERVLQLAAGRGFCEPILLPEMNVRRMIALQDAVVLIGTPDGQPANHTEVRWYALD